MKKLYMICFGGEALGANIEVHDVQFVIAEDMQDTYVALEENWYGGELHLDSYKALEGAEGFAITVLEEAYTGPSKLFFIHIGGYDPKVMGEKHKYGLIVAGSLAEAKRSAVKNLYTGEVQEHIDSIVEVTTAPLLNKVSSGYIHLNKTSGVYDLIPDWFGYKPLNSKA